MISFIDVNFGRTSGERIECVREREQFRFAVKRH